MEEETKPVLPKHKPWLMIALLGVILVLVAIVIYLLVVKKPFNQTAVTTATPSATAATVNKTATKIATKTVNPYSGWKTYKSTKYGVRFKYPSDYPDATENINDPQDIVITPVEYTTVKLSDDNTKSVDLSNVSVYGDDFKTDIDLLISNYNGTAEDMKTLWLPLGNAAIQANTVPEKIATPDNKWRGIYYFANIGNGYSTKLTAMVVLTDKTTIVQFALADELDKSADYPCLLSNSSCSADQVKSDARKLWDYVNTLKNDDNETVMKNFRSTYKKIIDSLKSI